MNKIAVIFWTGTGNTEVMASEVVAGAKEAGADVTLFNTSAFSADKAQEFDKFALGCPAMGAEELEDSEFQPLYDQLKTQISGKKVVLFVKTQNGPAKTAYAHAGFVPCANYEICYFD